jgi:murein DD-endopeptidase MepM/ murein hydrolase activator NlpD
VIRKCFLIALVISWSLIISSLQAQEAPADVTIHVVQRGETLFRIALRYSLTVDDLIRANSLTNPNNIQVGQRLLIPGAEPLAPEGIIHTVESGETLQSIAAQYGVTIEALVAANNLASIDRINVGQLLRITPLETASPPTQAPMSVPTSPLSEPAATIIHTVQPGETLFRIATRYGVTVNAMVAANNITDPTLIFAGQQLIVPDFTPPQLAVELPSQITSLQINPQVLVEGQTGIIRLTTVSPMTVDGVFLDRPLRSGDSSDSLQHQILVGVPIFTEPAAYPLFLRVVDGAGQTTELNLTVQVIGGGYGREAITLSADRLALLDTAVEASELASMRSLMSNFTPQRYWNGSMGLPAAAPVISPFGRRRSFNGSPFNRFHSGTDFAGGPGTSIIAPSSGVIVFVGVLDVRGRVTIIDHGWGVFTVYCHQTEQFVSVGDVVTTGQVIGTVGSTGRASGPHLHWEVWVNGVQVDPMQWVRQSFAP